MQIAVEDESQLFSYAQLIGKKVIITLTPKRRHGSRQPHKIIRGYYGGVERGWHHCAATTVCCIPSPYQAVAGMMLQAYGGVALLGASHGKSFGGNIGWENFLPMGGARPMGAFLTFDNLAPKLLFEWRNI